MRDKTLLYQLQHLPLDAKILMTEQRIREWYNYFHGDVCISFSGGKDSTVLTHIVHSMYPDVPLVFANTGLEYPEIQTFARKMGAEFVRPKMSFSEVISTYGYPIISKEVAEAIHFARRIVSKNPESLDSPEREREYEFRTETDRTLRKTEQRTHPSATQELHGRTGWRRANLTGRTPPARTIERNKDSGHSSDWNSSKKEWGGEQERQHTNWCGDNPETNTTPWTTERFCNQEV